MSRMLSKMNLISAVQQLPEDDIETIQGYVEMIEKENEELKEQLDYLRSGEYLNQLKFERDMLQDLVNNGEVFDEDKKFIDMTHRNTELLEENEELKKQYEKCLNDYCRLDARNRTQQQEFIDWLKAMSKMYEEEYKDINIAEHYNCVLQKYKEKK